MTHAVWGQTVALSALLFVRHRRQGLPVSAITPEAPHATHDEKEILRGVRELKVKISLQQEPLLIPAPPMASYGMTNIFLPVII